MHVWRHCICLLLLHCSSLLCSQSRSLSTRKGRFWRGRRVAVVTFPDRAPGSRCTRSSRETRATCRSCSGGRYVTIRRGITRRRSTSSAASSSRSLSGPGARGAATHRPTSTGLPQGPLPVGRPRGSRILLRRLPRCTQSPLFLRYFLSFLFALDRLDSIAGIPIRASPTTPFALPSLPRHPLLLLLLRYS